MAKSKKIEAITTEELNTVNDVLGRLLLAGEFTHMKLHVQSILGGMLLPQMVNNGDLDGDDENVSKLIEAYSKEKVKALLNPEPLPIEIERVVMEKVFERPVYRRIKHGLNKEKRMVKGLTPEGRDILIRWWNVNQRLVPKEDPVCVTLTGQVNSVNPSDDPLSPMQISGYFSHLCRVGLRIDIEREAVFQRSIKRGDHTVMPKFSQRLIDAIRENWERERALESTRKADHEKLKALREQGSNQKVVANV
jgi:hypothetical protein